MCTFLFSKTKFVSILSFASGREEYSQLKNELHFLFGQNSIERKNNLTSQKCNSLNKNNQRKTLKRKHEKIYFLKSLKPSANLLASVVKKTHSILKNLLLKRSQFSTNLFDLINQKKCLSVHLGIRSDKEETHFRKYMKINLSIFLKAKKGQEDPVYLPATRIK